jgi:hypothetical protein
MGRLWPEHIATGIAKHVRTTVNGIQNLVLKSRIGFIFFVSDMPLLRNRQLPPRRGFDG